MSLGKLLGVKVAAVGATGAADELGANGTGDGVVSPGTGVSVGLADGMKLG